MRCPTLKMVLQLGEGVEVGVLLGFGEGGLVRGAVGGVGGAGGWFQDYVEITKARISVMLGSNVAENVPVQQRLAESAGEIKSARLLLEASNELLHGRGVARQTLVPAELVEQARDRTMIAKLCVSAVTRLVGQMGALGIFDENPVQRHFRDVNAMATQIAVNYDRNMTTFGRWELGLPTGDPRIDAAPNHTGPGGWGVGGGG